MITCPSFITEMLRRCRGQYTEKMVDRCSRMGGAFGKAFHEQFCQSLGTGYESQHTRTDSKFRADVPALVREFHADGLFDYVPLREHKGFPAFQHRPGLSDEVQLGKHLLARSRHLSFWRDTARRRLRRRPGHQHANNGDN